MADGELDRIGELIDEVRRLLDEIEYRARSLAGEEEMCPTT